MSFTTYFSFEKNIDTIIENVYEKITKIHKPKHNINEYKLWYRSNEQTIGTFWLENLKMIPKLYFQKINSNRNYYFAVYTILICDEINKPNNICNMLIKYIDVDFP